MCADCYTNVSLITFQIDIRCICTLYFIYLQMAVLNYSYLMKSFLHVSCGTVYLFLMCNPNAILKINSWGSLVYQFKIIKNFVCVFYFIIDKPIRTIFFLFAINVIFPNVKTNEQYVTVWL